MSYEMQMNMIPDVYRQEDYPAPAGFPDMKKCDSPLPVMEDYLKFNYVGDPAYNKEAGLLAWTASYWDTSVPYRKQYFTDQVHIMQLTLTDLQAIAAGSKKAADFKDTIITAGGSTENRPAVLSDGTVLFLSDASVTEPLPERGTEEQRIINEYCMAPQLYAWKNGEVKKLTHMLHGVNSFLVSPDEKTILFDSWFYTEHDTEENMQKERTSEDRKRLLHENKYVPISYDTLRFKSDAEYGYASKRKGTRWLLDPASLEVTLFTDGSEPLSSPVWAPDSRYVIFRNPASENKAAFQKKDTQNPKEKSVFYASVTGVVHDYDMHTPVFSEDGRYFIFSVQYKKDGYNAPRALYMIPAEGGEDLTGTRLLNRDITVGGVYGDDYNFTSRGGDGSDLIALSGNRVLYAGCHEGDTALFGVSLGEDRKEPACLTGEFENFHCLVPVSDTLVVALFSDPLHLPEAALISADFEKESAEIFPLTDSNPWMKKKKLMQPVAIWAETQDRYSKVQGWVIPPADYDPAKKYPAILSVHGGPNGYYCTALNYELQAQAAAGYFLIFGNPRGGSGYGTYHAQDENAYGAIPLSDEISLVDEACRVFPAIDADRVGITGGSYGGYASIWAASHCARFKAASALRPLGNLQMIAASSLNAGGYPNASESESFLDVMLDCIHQSANSYADRIRIPFQILQSEKDGNCVPDQMHQLFVSIKDLHPDLPCRMVLYPDSCHGLLHKGPMYLAIMQRNDNLNWLKKYI